MIPAGGAGGAPDEPPDVARAGHDERAVRHPGQAHLVGVLMGHHGAGSVVCAKFKSFFKI